jgi:hypothetical protein
MTSPSLLRSYQEALAEAGLSLHSFDENYCLSYLNLVDELREIQVEGYQSASEEKKRRLAAELAACGGFWNHRIQKVATSVFDVTERFIEVLSSMTGFKLSAPSASALFIGEFPTREFNAEARLVEGGYLVLMNEGLPDLLQQKSRILTYARRYDPGSGSEVVTATARLCRGLCERYWTKSGFVVLSPEPNLPRPSAVDAVLNDWVFDSMLAFIVAHEIAHVALRHHHPGEIKLCGTAAINRVDNFNWQMELAADSMGLMILREWARLRVIETSKTEHIHDDWFLPLWNHSLYAPFFFFECERFLSITHDIDADIGSSTHPPAAMRQRFAMNLLRSHSEFDRWSLGENKRYRRFTRDLRAMLSEMQKLQGRPSDSLHRGSPEEFPRFVLDKYEEIQNEIKGETS